MATTHSTAGKYKLNAADDFVQFTDAAGNVLYNVTSTGAPGIVASQATTGLGVPPIVAESANSALGFASFGSAIQLLPSTAPAGTYRATVYAVVTTTIATATSWLFTLAFTDDKQAQTPTVMTSSTMTAGTANSGVYIFRSAGSAAITFTPTAASASAGVIAYSVVLERLI